jgi:hypothetical protein
MGYKSEKTRMTLQPSGFFRFSALDLLMSSFAEEIPGLLPELAPIAQGVKPGVRATCLQKAFTCPPDTSSDKRAV